MKILLCFGTRPEAIKMAPICKELESRQINFKVCVTGQHREMLDQVLDFFEIIPDYDLNIMQKGQSLNGISARILNGFDEVLNSYIPDLVLVHGDTTTSFVCAMAAFHRNIKIGHIEAGLRTYNKNAPYPEEANRQLTARVADFHFAPTKSARKNLLKEAILESNVFVTGNTVVDALLLAENRLQNYSELFQDLRNQIDFSKKVILVTGHRRENFGVAFKEICEAILVLAQKGFQIVFPVHLNPTVRKVVFAKLKHPNVLLLEPVSYPVFIWLMKNCDLIISDSGGIQEEAPSFGKIVLVTREVSERMEGVEAGYSKIVGHNSELIIENALEVVQEFIALDLKPNPYGNGQASHIIVNKILEFSNE